MFCVLDRAAAGKSSPGCGNNRSVNRRIPAGIDALIGATVVIVVAAWVTLAVAVDMAGSGTMGLAAERGSAAGR